MTPFYSAEARVLNLRIAAHRWAGTPFHLRAKLLGSGVDCVNLAAALYEASGFNVAFDFPAYTLQEGQNAERSKVIDWLDACPRFVAVAPPDPSSIQPGDLLCFRVGRGVEHHVGVFIGGEQSLFANSMIRYGVRLLSLAAPQWRKMLTAAFRPIEP